VAGANLAAAREAVLAAVKESRAAYARAAAGGLSATHSAKLLGVSRSTIRLWVAGKCEVPGQTAIEEYLTPTASTLAATGPALNCEYRGSDAPAGAAVGSPEFFTPTTSSGLELS